MSWRRRGTRRGLPIMAGKPSRWRVPSGPHLLITDLMMPHLNGAGLIAALRADAARSGAAVPPIILLTAASLTQARAAGADVVMRKPFRLAELEGLLHRLLGDP